MIHQIATVIGLDLALAADNAVVIAAVVATVPAASRRRVLLAGTAAAILLRIACTSGVVALLALPYAEPVGGVILLLVAASLLRTGADDPAAVRPARSTLAAVGMIAAADIALSVDNALAVAGVAHGSFAVVAVGLAVSVAVLMLAGSLLARVVAGRPWVMIAAAAVIAAVGIGMIR